MTNHVSEDQDYRLWALLSQTRDAVHNVRQRRLRAYGVSLEQAAVLSIVDMHGGKATPAQISRWLLRKHHSVLGILERMQKGGLLERSSELNNKNRVQVMLTEKGQQILHQASDVQELRNTMACLSDEDRQQLVSSLTRLLSCALEQAGALEKPEYPWFTLAEQPSNPRHLTTGERETK